MLCGSDANTESAGYTFAVNEIIRGIKAVSALEVERATPGWVAIQCPSESMAFWLRDAMKAENLDARAEGSQVFVPVGAHYTLTGEIKSVITVVAKTTHYWNDHLPLETLQSVEILEALEQLKNRVMGLLKRKPA